jgi:ATP-dependent 26S proteasome regulatory subunit
MFVNRVVVPGTLLTLLSYLITTTVTNYYGQRADAHDFSTTDESSLVTLVEQIKAETQLVNTNFLSNDNVSAKEHAKNAAKLMKDLDDNMTQTTPSSSDIMQIYDNGQRNSTTFALVVANIVDEILRKYASAFDIGYDLTNMSNMGTMTMTMTTTTAMPNGTNSSSPSMDMVMSLDTNHSNTLGEDTNSSDVMENNLVLVNKHDYETAQVLSDNINTDFGTQLRPRSPVNEMASIDILENGLQELKDAVNRKATPEDLMKIVHIQIHPMLQSIYDLRLVRNVVVPSSD